VTSRTPGIGVGPGAPEHDPNPPLTLISDNDSDERPATVPTPPCADPEETKATLASEEAITNERCELARWARQRA
jgi:hypothetical protein